jgi:hypothetical protein
MLTGKISGPGKTGFQDDMLYPQICVNDVTYSKSFVTQPAAEGQTFAK